MIQFGLGVPLWQDGIAQSFGAIPLQATLVVSGTLTIGGLLAPDGTSVGIYNDGVGLVTTATVSGGSGGFSVSFTSPAGATGTYFASYTDGSTVAGRSLAHAVGTSFDITIPRLASPIGSTVIRSHA